MKRKNIFYIGTDETITDRLQEYYDYRYEMGDHSLYTVERFDTDDDKWVSTFYKRSSYLRPHLIYLDFTDFEDEERQKDALNFLELIRGHVLLKASVIVGIFSSARGLEELRVVFSLGVVYSVIKGNGIEYYKDAHYMAFDGGVRFERYATAANMRLPFKVSLLSSLVSLTPEQVEMDFDIEIDSGERVDIQQHLFDDFSCEYLKILDTRERPIRYSYLRHGRFEIPYPGPWEEVSEDQLQKETVETWVDLNLEKEGSSVGHVLIVGKNYLSNSSLEMIKEYPQLVIRHVSNIDSNYAVLDNFKPDIIIVELNDIKDEEEELDDELYLRNDYSHLSRVLHYVASEEFEKKPLVVTYNNPSTSVATQKVLKYQRIISSPEKYDCRLVSMLLKSYCNKVPPKTGQQKYSFKNDDKRRCIELIRDCYVTSISEHEFTFISKDELPLFEIIEINVPVKMYCTLIPPIRYIQGDPLGQHYMAFIHGLEESGLREIRRFVNYALQKTLDKFEVAPNMPKIIEERELQREEYERKKQEQEEEVEQPLKDKHEEYVVDRKKTYSGISKL